LAPSAKRPAVGVIRSAKTSTGRLAIRARLGQPPKAGAVSQTVRRALDILRVFNSERDELGVTEISGLLKLPKTIVFRLLRTLMEYEFLEQNAANSKYRIGIGAFEVGNLFKNSTLEAEAAPFMRNLVDETGHTAQLAVMYRNEMVIIARMEGRGPLKYGVSVGERRPLHSSAVGKAALSVLEDYQIDLLMKEAGLKKATARTITELAVLKADLSAVRTRGYSVNWEENTVGVASLAAPISPKQSHTVAALALAFPASATAKKDMPRIGKLLSAAARTLTARL
jgi:DNA-binding IclR family transcriptional regulator